MPELPEIETIRRYLEEDVIGRKIKDVRILNKKSFIGDKKKILNSKILKIERKGKMLIFKLTTDKYGFGTDKNGLTADKNGLETDNNGLYVKQSIKINYSHKFVQNLHKSVTNYPHKSVLKSASIRWLVFHLKLTGQLIFLNFLRNSEIKKYTRVIFVLDKGFLIFNDARKFGWVKVLDDEDLSKELSKIGKEPFDLNFKYLKEIFSKTKRPIKIVLMDQEKIAGLGNIYANEALFLAKIHPLRPANKLKDSEIKDLLSAIKKVIKKAIKLQGTSFRFYVKPDESKGSYQEEFLVYQRKNEKCLRCKSKVKYIKIGGRGTFYCSNCQKWKE
jgi:formamidopyrimidine-DNA glycosylase